MRGFKATALDDYIALQEGINDHRIRAVLRFSGRIDETRLREAARRSAAVAPLLACGYARRAAGGRWMEGAEAMDEARYCGAIEAAPGPEAEAAVDKALAAPIDQEHGPQFHITLIRSGGRDSLCIVMNHVVMDGAGFKAWLGLLARLYSGGSPSPEDARRERDILALMGGRGGKPRTAGAGRRGAGGARRPGRRIDILEAPRAKPESRDARPRLFSWRCALSELQALRGGARGPKPSLNDCAMALVAAAIAGVGAGGAGSEAEAGGSPLELAFMVDARRYDAGGALSPYSNASSIESVSIINISRPAGELAAEIARETAGIKAGSPGLGNILLMRDAAAVLPPPLLGALLRRKMRATRLSTTNLGSMDPGVLRFGGLDVEDCYFVTALKEEPGLQFSFSSFRGAFTITSYGRYSDANAGRIAEIYGGFGRVLGLDAPALG